MGEGISNVGSNVQQAALAAQASEDVKKKIEKKDIKKTDAGAMLKDMPKAAEQNVEVKEMEKAESTEEVAETILTDIDQQLENVQKGLKEYIGKKIKLAAKNPTKGKELLQSAYNDTKKAYDKIKKVRDQLA